MLAMRDRVAVVTGAGSGIGCALAEQAAAAGMAVVAADVDMEGAERTARGLREAGARADAVRCDVADPTSVDELAAASWRLHGRVDLLCNNAGVSGPLTGPLWTCTPDDWQWVTSVNLYGVANGIRSFLPQLAEQDNDSHVVNTASVAGVVSAPFCGPYNASKYGVVALSQQLAREVQALDLPIGVSVLLPGWTTTNILGSGRSRPTGQTSAPVDEDLVAALTGLVSSGQSPDHVARTVMEAVRRQQFWIYTDDTGRQMAALSAHELASHAPPGPLGDQAPGSGRGPVPID